MGDTTTQHKEISIHTPTQGVTLYGYVFSKKYNDFNPHSHAGSDDTEIGVPNANKQFQSTLTRRE